MVLSQWDQAVALAQEHSLPQVHSLLFKYAAMLLGQHKTMEAVQLYRKVRHLLPCALSRFSSCTVHHKLCLVLLYLCMQLSCPESVSVGFWLTYMLQFVLRTSRLTCKGCGLCQLIRMGHSSVVKPRSCQQE